MPVDHIAKIREYGENLAAEEHGGVGAHTDPYCLAIIAHSILSELPGEEVVAEVEPEVAVEAPEPEKPAEAPAKKPAAKKPATPVKKK